jgi:hypothetical protein
LDLLDDDESGIGDKGNNKDERPATIVPLPSNFLPDQISTPFLYGMQISRPVHKLLVEEAISIASMENWSSMTKSSSPSMSIDDDTGNIDAVDDEDSQPVVSPLIQPMMKEAKRPMYGHLIWKDRSRETLIGAIGCTTEILVHGNTGGGGGGLVDNDRDDIKSPTLATVAPDTILGRGGFRFRVKEVIKTIPFPIAVVDEIQDDTNDDDSEMFSSVTGSGSDTDDDDDDDDDDDLRELDTPQLIQQIIRLTQSILSQRLDEAHAKTRLSPLEKSILEDSQRLMGNKNEDRSSVDGINSGLSPVNMAEIELAHAEEMVAVWEVFQLCLVDDILPQDRRFAVAIMAAELADLDNKTRKQILLTRNGVERLRIVLRQVHEIAGMARARKMAETITEKVIDDEKDLKVGVPLLPPWAKQIKRGTRIEYFWNEEYGWCGGEVIEDPVRIVDEILLTIRFDDGETHRLPLAAEDKVRWRPG